MHEHAGRWCVDPRGCSMQACQAAHACKAGPQRLQHTMLCYESSSLAVDVPNSKLLIRAAPEEGQ
jgi:hypothetical protein